MPFYGGSVGQGYSDSVDADSQRQVRSAEVARLLQAISQQATTFQNAQQDRTRALDTRQGFGNLLYGLTPPGPSQTGPLPPAPGQASAPATPPTSAPSPGALPPPPGASGAPAPAAAPAGPSGSPASPAGPSFPPYRAVPEPQPGAEPGSIPPPPAPPPQPEVKLPSPMSLLAKIKAAGVDPGKAADYLDQYAPLYKAQQEQEFKQMQAELRAQQAAMTAYKTVMEAQERKLKGERDDKRLDQGDRRLDQADERNEQNARRTDALIAKMNRPAASGSAANALDQDDYKFIAQQYLAGDRTVMQNLGRGKQGGEDVRGIRKAIRTEAAARGMTPEHVAIKIAEFEGLKAGERTAGTREAQLGFAAHELEQFLPLAEAASTKVPRTDFKAINQLIQAGENQWSPEQAAFVAANRSVINAFSLVASRGAQTVHNVQEAEKMLNTASSHDVYKAVLKQLDLETKAALKAPKQVREDLADRGAGKPAVQTATNPKTGEKLELRDGKWLPVAK